MLAVGALAVPAYALTGSSVTTYNATLILTLALSALTMFLLGRELSGSAWAGVIAGASFASTTANYDSLARIQIVSSQWTPLTLFFLVRTLRSRRWRDGVGCGLAFALQWLGRPGRAGITREGLVEPYWLARGGSHESLFGCRVSAVLRGRRIPGRRGGGPNLLKATTLAVEPGWDHHGRLARRHGTRVANPLEDRSTGQAVTDWAAISIGDLNSRRKIA
jgi:hypothetical protein